MATIQPHGGTLVNRVLKGAELERGLEAARELPQVRLDDERTKEVRNIARGVYSPVTGFMTEAETMSVLADEHLLDGTVWTIPLLLDVAKDPGFSDGDAIALTTSDGRPLAVMAVEDVYTWDPKAAARAIFATDSTDHPGVRRTLSMGERLVGGSVQLLSDEKVPFPEMNLDPWETRYLFKARGYKTVAGFQTRNPPHTAHEAVHRTALSLTDALFINPVIGRKKPGDFRDEVIMDAYQALCREYYPADRVVLSILPYEMRYGGPKEAILHAIIRKNYGCTHFIVGRDHAGVGNFYGPEEAIEKFASFPDLGIQPLAVKGDFDWCTKCQGLSSERTCSHTEAKTAFSGTKVREMVRNGTPPAAEVMRPEVFAAIAKHDQPFTE